MSRPTERAIAAAVLRWTRAVQRDAGDWQTLGKVWDAEAALLAIGKRLAKEEK